MVNATTSSTAAATQPSAARALAGGTLGKQEFLQMLVAQLRNQDPMNPMEGQEFAAQLAQFSSVEQLIELNAKLEDQMMASGLLLQAANSGVALSTLGRTVLAEGNQVVVAPGAEVTVEVDGSGMGTLELLDAEGEVVGRRELGWLGSGRQTIALGAAAEDLPEGVYDYRVTVTATDGDDVAVRHLVTGTVDGVRYGADGATLTAGKLSIPVGSVVEVGTTR